MQQQFVSYLVCLIFNSKESSTVEIEGIIVPKLINLLFLKFPAPL